MRKLINFNLFVLLLAILLSLPIILPYFHTGYFPTHDGEWAVVRLTEMFREIRDLQFPARFSDYLNFGYGYPLFNFAYPLPYYFGIILHSLKFGFVDSIKIIFAITVPLSFIFMYLASFNLWKSKLAGIVSAILYIYLPYRMVDLYVRGSIGESMSFVLFALIFYLIIKIADNPSSKLLIASGAISYALLIMTHNIMAILFTIVLILFIFSYLFLEKKKELIFPFITLVVFGFSLSSFFWIPAVFEKNNILLSVIPIADRNLYYVNLQKLILPSWGYGTPTDNNAFTYQLGLTHLLILISSLLFIFFNWFKNIKYLKDLSFKYAAILIAILFFLIFSMFSQASLFWKLPILSEINYPWTMLALIGFLISLLSGFLASRKSIIKYFSLILAVIAIFIFLPYAKPQHYIDRGDDFYMTNDATTTSSREYTPLWVKEMSNQRPKEKIEIVRGNGEVNSLIYNSKKIMFNINTKEDAIVRVNTIYYPGWKAQINGNPTNIVYNNDKGVMEVPLKAGIYNVKFSFSETPLRLFADFLSILSLVVLVIYIKFSKHIKRVIKFI